MTSRSVAYPAGPAEHAPAQVESAAFLRAFIGSAVLLLTISAAEPLFFGEGYFSTLTYHPFWIVVLLAAVQHGLFVGVATVGLATLMMDWPPRPVGVDITAHYVDMATTPTQWLIVALLIGSYRQAQIRRDQQVRRHNARLAVINDTLATEIHRLDAALMRAELSAATRPEAASQPSRPRAALDALAQLSVAGAADRADAFVAAARACSDAGIAWFEVSPAGDLVLRAATHPGIEIPASASARDLPACSARPKTFAPGEGLAPEAGHALCLPVIPTAAREPVGGVVAFADSPQELPGLTSTLTLLARALEAAVPPAPPDAQGVRLGSDAPDNPAGAHV